MSFYPEELEIRQPTTSVAPVDPLPIIENGNSPTAIILATSILVVSLLGAVTSLARVLLTTSSVRNKEMPISNKLSVVVERHSSDDLST